MDGDILKYVYGAPNNHCVIALRDDQWKKNFAAMFEFRQRNGLYCGDSIVIPKTAKEIESRNIKRDIAFGCINPVLGGMAGSWSSVKPDEIVSMTILDRKTISVDENNQEKDYPVTYAQSLYLPLHVIDQIIE